MRVLIVSSLFAPWRAGGAEVIAEASAEALSLNDHDVFVVTLSATEERDDFRNDRYPIIQLPLFNSYALQDSGRATLGQKMMWHVRDRWNKKMAGEFENVLKEVAPQVVLLHNITGFSVAIYEVMAQRGIPFVQVLHDHYFICLYTTMYQSSRRCIDPCIKCRIARHPHLQASKLASGVVGVSQYILQRVTGTGMFQGVLQAVIHNVSPPLAHNFTNHQREDGGITVGYLGLIAEPKGVTDLIRAFMSVAGPLDRLCLGGNVEPSLRKYLSNVQLVDHRIRWLGLVDRDAFFSSIDLLVVPSRAPESFGLVAQEACVRGVRVLVSNVGALSEVVSSYPWAVLYSLDEPNGLENSLRHCLQQWSVFNPSPAWSQIKTQQHFHAWGNAYSDFLLKVSQ